jgi:hypothetical protein
LIVAAAARAIRAEPAIYALVGGVLTLLVLSHNLFKNMIFVGGQQQS